MVAEQRHGNVYEHARVGIGSSTPSETRTDEAKTSDQCICLLLDRQRSGRRRHLSRRAAQRVRDLGRGQGVQLEGVDGGFGRCDAAQLHCIPIDSRHSAACCALSQLTGSCLTLGRCRSASKASLGGVSRWVGSDSERSDPTVHVYLSSENGWAPAGCTRPKQCSGWSRGRVSCVSTVEYLTVVASPPSVVCVGRKDYLNWET